MFLTTGHHNRNCKFIWDVEKNLKYLKQLWANANLLDQNLELKLTMLLAVIADSRCSDLWQHQIRNIYLNFQSHGEEMLCHSLWFSIKFQQDQSLCMVLLLDTYLQRTQSWRHGGEIEQLPFCKTTQWSCKEYYCRLV